MPLVVQPEAGHLSVGYNPPRITEALPPPPKKLLTVRPFKFMLTRLHLAASHQPRDLFDSRLALD